MKNLLRTLLLLGGLGCLIPPAIQAQPKVISPYMLKQVGATDAQCLTWSDSNDRWEPANCSSSATLADGDYGDITVSGTGTVLSVDSGAVNFSELAGAATTGQLPSGATLDTEWDTIGEIETVTGVNILLNTELATEAALEALLGDVSDVFTNNDGALNDDNLANNTIGDLSGVTITAWSTGEVLRFNGSALVDAALTEADISDLSHTVDTTLSQEEVEDYAGALVAAGTGTHTGITITYQDATGDIDFVVGGLTATELATDSVSADELNATGVEAELEAVLDLQDLQGAVTDGQVPDTITVSNYLPLSGGTLTGVLVTDNLGIEFTESDTNPSCVAGYFGIYADLSEGIIKKCQDGSATDLDTTGGTPSFDTITGGTNTGAAMVVGTGASLGVSGSGTINATTLESTALTDFLLEAELDTIAELQSQIADATLLTTADEGTGNGIDADTVDALEATAFAWLAGQSGGQTLIGGTGVGDDLTLQTTSNASKGSYIFSELTSCDTIDTNGSGVLACGTDDDVPESGDFGAGADLEADGSLSADVVAAAEMADADHGDVAWSSGVASVQAIDGVGVEVTGVTDGQCLVYDGTTDNRWEAASCGGGGSSINLEEDNSEVISAANLTGLDFGTGFDVTDSANEGDISLDLTELNDQTWGNNTDATISLTFNPSGATQNPIIAIADSVIELQATTVRLGASGGNKLSWDLSGLTTDRTVYVPDSNVALPASPSAGAQFALSSAANAYAAVSLSGDINVDSSGVATIQAAAVTLTTDVTGTLPVANGGTGATTLTDGGILLGSGTGAITALGVATNGQIPIGDGTTDPVLATLSAEGGGEISITNGAGSITLDVVEANLDLASIGGTLGASQGGTNLNTSSSTGTPKVTSGTWSVVQNEYVFWPEHCTVPSSNGALIQRPSDWTEMHFSEVSGTGDIVHCKLRLPSWWTTGDTTVKVFYKMAAATSGNIEFGVQMKCVSPGDSSDLDAKAYDTQDDSGDDAVPGTAGYPAEHTWTLDSANTDAGAAGDFCMVELQRVEPSTSEATGEAEVLHFALAQ